MAQKSRENNLKNGEVLDDLQLNNLKIIQNRNLYCFTSDSVMLSNFVKAGTKDKVIEFCSGCGVISILVNEKCKPKTVFGIEIDKNLYDMSVRSLKYNNISNINFVCDDAKNVLNYIKRQSFDVALCNPPYFILNKNEDINEKYLSAKYETTITLQSLFESVSNALKFGGKFFMCFTPTRIQELLSVAKQHNFILKKMQFVYPENKKKLSTLVLCYFIKNGNKFCDVVEPKLV